MTNEDTHKIEEFVNNGTTYIYDSSRINIEQAELSREVIEFKGNSLKNQAKDFNQILRSRASDWLIMSASYLLLEKNADGTISEFNRDSAINRTEPFIKNLPAKEINRLKECVLNFFTDTALHSVILELSSSNDKSYARNTVSSMLLEAIMQKSFKDHTLNKES